MPAAIARLTALALFTTSLLAAPALAEDAAPASSTNALEAPDVAADGTPDAAADPTTDAAAAQSTRSGYVPKPAAKSAPMAIGVNLPFGWYEGRSIAGSLYAGVGTQGAIRLNVASYKNGPSLGAEAFIGLLGAEDEGSYSGRTLDLGVSYVHYTRKRWDGFMVEVGALRRAKDHRTVDEYSPVPDERTNTTMYGGRAMIGWSWLIDDWAFVAFGVGASMGIERGTETVMSYDEMPATSDVNRPAFAAEGFLRIGGAFEL